jgi:hypothetical protein
MLIDLVIFPADPFADRFVLLSQLENQMFKAASIIIMLSASTAALAESPYPMPNPDGAQRIQRTGTCPTGYFASGKFCEALHKDTPAAMPKIKGASCPSGYFANGGACTAFR